MQGYKHKREDTRCKVSPAHHTYPLIYLPLESDAILITTSRRKKERNKKQVIGNFTTYGFCRPAFP